MKKLLLILLLVCFPVNPATHFSWGEWIKETVFGEDIIEDGSDFIHIEAPYRALNGGNVPIKYITKNRGYEKYNLIFWEKLFSNQLKQENIFGTLKNYLMKFHLNLHLLHYVREVTP